MGSRNTILLIDELAKIRKKSIVYLYINEIIIYNLLKFDTIALIYAHFPAKIKSSYHKQFDRFLKKSGTIIFESFSKKHVDYVKVNERVVGPKDIESLFSIDEIKTDFLNFTIIELVEQVIELNEGHLQKNTRSKFDFWRDGFTLKNPCISRFFYFPCFIISIIFDKCVAD